MEIAEAFRTQMNDCYRDHPDEEALERFILHKCSEEELEIVETHVLACESCVAQLETLELDITATKMALESWRRCRSTSKRPKPSAHGRAGLLFPDCPWLAALPLWLVGQFSSPSRTTSP